MFITIYILLFLVFFLYVALRAFILYKSQGDKTCRICRSKDTERVARSAWIKKFFLSKHLHKYWCRKCGNKFYLKSNDE